MSIRKRTILKKNNSENEETEKDNSEKGRADKDNSEKETTKQ